MAVGPILLEAVSRGLDRAVHSQLGRLPFDTDPGVSNGRVDPDAFWTASRLGAPCAVTISHDVHPSRGGMRVVDLEGPSSGRGGHRGGSRLLARARLHPGQGRPLVVILHGFAVPVPLYDEWYAQALARDGVDTVRMDLPFHLRRRMGGQLSGVGYFAADLAVVRGSLRQSVEDAAAVVAWARGAGARRVGVLGFSLGGLVALLLAAHVPLDRVLAVTPFCDPPATFLCALPPRARRKLGLLGSSGGVWGNDLAAARATLEAELAPVVPDNLVPVTPGERITVVAAGLDRFVGRAPVRRLAEAWGTDLWEYPHHGHISVLGARGLAPRVRGRLRAGLAA